MTDGGISYGNVELLVYPACPLAPGVEDNCWFDLEQNGPECGAREDASSAGDFEERLAEECRRSFEAGRERGQLEGHQVESEAQTANREAAHALGTHQAAEFISRFAAERDRYMHAIEHEVVKLALAVAARILRREAQVDPLLLTGAVRVALGQLASSTEVRLLVPATEIELWSDTMAHLPNLAIRPTVRAGEGMRLGDCVIETALGSVDLGIRSQLGEIERGFFDRAGHRQTKVGCNPLDRSDAEENA